jgi:hypothetical protein
LAGNIGEPALPYVGGNKRNDTLNIFALSGGEMAAFLVAGAIVGVILGLRFRVLVLVPAILLATLIIVLSGSGHQNMLLTLIGTVVSLQMGYVAGSIPRFSARSYLLEWMCSRCSDTEYQTNRDTILAGTRREDQ